jgi:hypothetical protein
VHKPFCVALYSIPYSMPERCSATSERWDFKEWSRTCLLVVCESTFNLPTRRRRRIAYRYDDYERRRRSVIDYDKKIAINLMLNHHHHPPTKTPLAARKRPESQKSRSKGLSFPQLSSFLTGLISIAQRVRGTSLAVVARVGA